MDRRGQCRDADVGLSGLARPCTRAAAWRRCAATIGGFSPAQCEASITSIASPATRLAPQALLDQALVGELCRLPGERHDVADVMRDPSCFVLPSLDEGNSNTIRKTLVTGLPVIGTAASGNTELVTAERTGEIVPPADAQTLADCVLKSAANPRRAAAMGSEGRADAESRCSMEAMVGNYPRIYDRELTASGRH